ncbi:MAG TPA: hypothetical protein VF027_06155 [Sphingomicrobium sp.]
MFKSLIALAIAGAMSVPATAQTAPADQQPKPQTVKKRVCYQDEADSYSRLGGRKICKTIEVPVQQDSGGGSGNQQQQPAPGHAGSR